MWFEEKLENFRKKVTEIQTRWILATPVERQCMVLLETAIQELHQIHFKLQELRTNQVSLRFEYDVLQAQMKRVLKAIEGAQEPS